MSAGEESREAAEGFGDAAEDALEKAGDAVDALQGERPDPPPRKPDGGGGVTINIDND